MKKLLLIFSGLLLANISLGQSDSVNYFISDTNNSELFEEEFMKTDKEKYFYSEFLMNKAQSVKHNKTVPLVQLSITETKGYGQNHYNQTVSWITERVQYFYDDNFNMVELFSYLGGGNADMGQYYGPALHGKTQKLWDNNNRLQQVIEYIRNENLQQCCFPKSKLRYYYTAWSDVSQIDFYSWLQDSWVLAQRKYYSFDNETRLTGISSIQYDAANEQYTNIEKTEIIYDTVGNSSTEIIFKWDTAYNVWIAKSKNIYFVDSLQRPMQIDKFVYQVEDQTWKINQRFEFLHNSDNTVSDIIQWFIHQSYGYFRKMQKLHLVYNNDNMTFASVFYWSDSLQDFNDEGCRVNYYYNNSYSEGEFILPFKPSSLYQGSVGFNTFTTAHPVTGIGIPYWNGYDWMPYSSKGFFHMPISVSNIPSLLKNTTYIFPNPAHNNVHVNLLEDLAWAEFRLYDLSGKLLLETAVHNGSEVVLYSVRPGIYVYKIIGDDLNFTGKLVVE